MILFTDYNLVDSGGSLAYLIKQLTISTTRDEFRSIPYNIKHSSGKCIPTADVDVELTLEDCGNLKRFDFIDENIYARATENWINSNGENNAIISASAAIIERKYMDDISTSCTYSPG